MTDEHAVADALMPDRRALQMLALVRDEGSLSAAARTLGLSQQALSEQVRSLEKKMALTLLVRTTTGSQLTADGMRVAAWAEELLRAARRFDGQVAGLRAESRPHLAVAASLTVAEHLLPHWLATLQSRMEAARRPLPDIEVTAVNSGAVSELVRRGKVALGFIETPDVPADLVTRRLGFDRLQVVVAPGHAWTRRSRPIDIDELASTPLVLREPGSGTRRALEATLADRSRTLVPPRAELPGNAAVRAAIANGVAPGVLSSLAIADDRALGRLVEVPVDDIDLARPVCAVWSTGAEPYSALARELVQIAVAAPASR